MHPIVSNIKDDLQAVLNATVTLRETPCVSALKSELRNDLLLFPKTKLTQQIQPWPKGF